PAAWPGGQGTAVGAAPGDPRLWAASYDGREARVLSLLNGAWTTWKGPAAFGRERIDAVQPDGKGTIWARDAHHLWVLRPGQAAFEDAYPGIPLISARAVLRLGPDGTLYVPTDMGLWLLSEGRWTHYDAGSGLDSFRVRDAIRDREGSLWVGSQGIHRLLGRGLWRAYTQVDGLPDSVVWTIFRSREGALYVGTDGGLAKAGPKGWELLPATAGQVVRTVVEAPDGTFYLGSLPVRVIHLDPRSGRVLGTYDTGQGLRGKRLFRILLDPSNRLWVSTEDAGLYSAQLGQGPVQFKREEVPGGPAGEYFNGLTLGPSGRIYASGEYGLAVLDHGQWRRYTEADGLKRRFVAYALERKDGSVMVGYFESSGLSILRPGTDGVLRAQVSDELTDRLAREKVYMLGEDGQGRAWVGTGRGVYVGDGRDVQRFGLADGLVSEDIDNMAFLSDPGGDVWVGTSGGLARFDAKAYQSAPAPPATVFLSQAFGDRPVDPAAGAVQVPYGRNTLLARFAGLSFLGERTVDHEVQLEGLETTWHLTDTKEARYPALAPGAYTLRVRSRVMHGAWGPEAAFAFEILPAWWQTWWFKALLVLAGAASVLGLIRWRVAALRRHNQELEALVHARTAELEAANEALQAQSVTDSLTGLKNRRYLSACMPEDVARVRRVHRQLNGDASDRAHVNVDLVLVMVDLDHFKEVNDTYGHAAGDLVLQQVAEILRGAIRDMDTVVRWGGEEFLVVARKAARSEAMVLVERIRSRIAAHPFELGDGQTIRRTCSVGFAYMPFLCAEPEFMDWEEVVDVADHCLYVAKHSGRDAWVGLTSGLEIHSDQLGPKVSKRLPELIRSGLIQVLTSREDPESLDWEG
ncbi:MAG TPA: diguanylate cyclase, partial [Holophagaceae bacterium]|nr:diguanylate cyclase [Holophagaceae bacterium]